MTIRFDVEISPYDIEKHNKWNDIMEEASKPQKEPKKHEVFPSSYKKKNVLYLEHIKPEL